MAFVLGCGRVDGPERGELVAPGGFGEVEGEFAGECGIRGTVCGEISLLFNMYVLCASILRASFLRGSQ